MARIISNTNIYLTSSLTNTTLSFGEGGLFPINEIKGLDIGEIEKETAANALNDGSIFLGSRVTERVLTIKSEWGTAAERKTFKDFFNHRAKFATTIVFDGRNYYGSCVLSKPYETENNDGNLYSGAEIELELYFPDPYLFTDNVYDYSIGYWECTKFWFSKTITKYLDYNPQGTFAVIQEPAIYTINNPNSSENGIEVRMLSAYSPIVKPKIFNLTTGKYMEFDITVPTGSLLYINTQMGYIEAKMDNIDILRYLTMGSDLIQVSSGTNQLLVSANAGAGVAECNVTFRERIIAL